MADRRRQRTTPQRRRSPNGRSSGGSSAALDGGQLGDIVEGTLPGVPTFNDGIRVNDPTTPDNISPVWTFIGPEPPENLAVTGGANENIVYFDVSWDAAAGDGADNVQSYQLDYKRSDASEWTSVRTRLTSVRVQPVEALTDYDFRVQSISWAGVAGDFSATLASETSGVDATAPAAVAGLTLTVGLRTIFIRFTANTEADLDHYRIQVDDTSSAFGSLVHDGLADANLVAVSDLLPDTQYWVRVAAVDRSGNQGTWSSTATDTTDLTGTSDLAADSVTAAKLAAIELEVGKHIRSTTFTTGSAGWNIEADGSAEFNDVTVRGTVETSNLQANTISSDNTVLNVNGGNETAPTAGELLTNSSFDTNVTGWTGGTNTTLAQVATPTQAGAGAMRLTSGAAATTLTATSDAVACEPLSTYKLTGYFRTAATARACGLRALFYDDANTLISGAWGTQGSSTITDASGSYTAAAEIWATAPPNAATVKFQANIANAANGEIHYFDTASLTEQCRGWGYIGHLDGDGAWAHDQLSITRDTAEYFSGSASVKVTAAAGQEAIVGTLFTPEDGATYRLYAAIRNQGSTVITVDYGIAWLPADLSGTTYSYSKTPLAAPNVDFVPWTDTFEVPETGGPYVYGIPFVRATSSGADFWIDDLAVVRTSVYTDGLVQPDLVISQGHVYDQGAGLLGPGLVCPPGVVLPFAGSTLPPGWLWCDGDAIDRWYYARLFGIIGVQFGSGDGSTTFNLPDMRGRVPVALDNLGGSDAGRLSAANTVGGTGGTETHTLTSAEMPTHTHPLAQTLVEAGVSATVNYDGGSAGGTTGFTGSGSAHNNMQPYLLLNYIIKT
jgi:microcystin-dependent protein